MPPDHFPNVPFRRWIFVQRIDPSKPILPLFEGWAEFVKSDWDTFRAAKGGLMTCPQIVTTPDQREFFTFSYNKDFDFWRTSMINFCVRSGLEWAEILDGHFQISDARSFEVSQCELRTEELRGEIGVERT